MFNKFKKLETSKKLVSVVSSVWVFSIIIGFIGILFSFNFIPIITIVNIDFLIVLGYYFTKAGTENVVKGLLVKTKAENIYDSINNIEDVTIPEDEMEY